MVEAAISMHLDQVEACFDAGGGPGLEKWRAGSRDKWPALTGFQGSGETHIHPPAVGKSLGPRHGKLQDRGSLTQMLSHSHRQAPIHKHGSKVNTTSYTGGTEKRGL